MATALDLELVPVAQELLAEFGKLVTLTISSANRSYEPGAGEERDPTPRVLSVKASPPSPVYLRYFKSEIMVAAETSVFIAGGDIVGNDPSLEGTITIDGLVYAILGSQRFYSGEQVALWGFALGTSRV